MRTRIALAALVVASSSIASSLTFAKILNTTCYGGMTGWHWDDGPAAMDIVYKLDRDETVLFTAASVLFYCDMFSEPDGPCEFCTKSFIDVWWLDSTTSIPWETQGADEVAVDCWDFVGEPTDYRYRLIGDYIIYKGKASEIQEKPAIVRIVIGSFPKGAGECPDDPFENHDQLYRNAGGEWVDIFERHFEMEGFWDNW